MADAVTAAGELGCNHVDGFVAIARALDVVVPAATAPDRPTRRRRRRPPPPERRPDADAAADPAVDETATPVGAAIRARMRIEDAGEPAPDWVGAVEAFDLPVSRPVAIPPQPPLPALTARASLGTVAATRRATRRLDVRKLIRRAAQLQPFSPPPLLAELRTAPALQLLVDRGEGMEPYAADVRFLVRQLTDVAGRDRVERHTFVRTPLEGVDPDPFSDEAEPWRPAAAGLVIAITDLGAGGPLGSVDRGSAREWCRVAETAAQHGDLLRVLTPFGPGSVPDELTGIADVFGWDALGELVRLRG
jgi:hypothetical protein